MKSDLNLKELRHHKKILENTIKDLLSDFQEKTDLKVRKIHLNINLDKSKCKEECKKEFVNVILKGL